MGAALIPIEVIPKPRESWLAVGREATLRTVDLIPVDAARLLMPVKSGR